MSGDKNRITAGLVQAIQYEFDGHHFYLMAARATEDEQGRRVFEQLAEEELAHLRFLHLQKLSFERIGQADTSVELGQPAEFSEENAIFSPLVRERIKEAHFEMSALSIGLQLEYNSEKFYREQANEAEDPTVKAFFNTLAEWEGGHYRALSEQLEELKDQFWISNEFAPW